VTHYRKPLYYLMCNGGDGWESCHGDLDGCELQHRDLELLDCEEVEGGDGSKGQQRRKKDPCQPTQPAPTGRGFLQVGNVDPHLYPSHATRTCGPILVM